ncbi:putative HIT-type Zinc finger family protein [Hibiscus syriacus]|uniref:HIT-type Zinc finger family protein n=1 Tax=Hibiscus syriacus TaxID=106335 RepID=A0A6A2XX95_HIBSY|nr:putative HIT-type Zinc finger family protein [Hibiscus syriacus]
MASSSGSSISNSSGSSEQDLHVHRLMDQRKRRRMESNRESVRRSRTSIGFTTQHYINIEAENSVLRAQMMELSQRLESLNEIVDHINSPKTCNGVNETVAIELGSDCFTNLFNLPRLCQPIVASPDNFQC